MGVSAEHRVLKLTGAVFPIPSSSSSLCPVATSPDRAGDGLTSSEALGDGGVKRNLLMWVSVGQRGPLYLSGVGQHQHCPHGLGVGGAKTQAGKGQVLSEEGGKYTSSFSLAACPPGSYKAKQGEGPCLPCPPNSRTTSPAASICTCHNNFYRADSDTADSACTST